MLSSFIDKVQTSTSSLASSVSVASSSIDDFSPRLKEGMRRMSMPLGKARDVSSRRLSQMVNAIGEAFDQDGLLIGVHFILLYCQFDFFDSRSLVGASLHIFTRIHRIVN